jgi:hypothetical protein
MSGLFKKFFHRVPKVGTVDAVPLSIESGSDESAVEVRRAVLVLRQEFHHTFGVAHTSAQSTERVVINANA